MEEIGIAILAFAGIAWFMYTAWRDNRRWNKGVCKETGQFWEFTGGVSFMGQFCYSGGFLNLFGFQNCVNQKNIIVLDQEHPVKYE